MKRGGPVRAGQRFELEGRFGRRKEIYIYLISLHAKEAASKQKDTARRKKLDIMDEDEVTAMMKMPL